MPAMSDMLWPAISIFGMGWLPFSGFWSCAQRAENSTTPERNTAYCLGMAFPAFFSTNPARQQLFLRIFGAAREYRSHRSSDATTDAPTSGWDGASPTEARA